MSGKTAKTRNYGGRPKLDSKIAKKERVMVYLTGSQKAKLQKMSDKKQRSMAELCLKALAEAKLI